LAPKNRHATEKMQPSSCSVALKLVIGICLLKLGAQADEHDISDESSHTETWQDSDTIDVFYAEFLLAQWVLNHAPWNAYHSALAFQHIGTEARALYDYTPLDTSSVMNMVLPEVNYSSLWRASVLGEVTFTWRDGAKVQFHTEWPEQYTSFVRLGSINGSMYRKFAAWVKDDFVPNHTAFQPTEVAYAYGTNPTNKVLIRSRMCHDFVTDSLWVLYNAGARMHPEGSIFRDHIIMYAEAVEPAHDLVKTKRGARKWMRYLRTLFMYLAEIKEQFTSAREALVVGWKLGMEVFVHDEHKEYLVRLVPPFLNYCYLPLAIPPELHDPFGQTKLCALGLVANTTNTSAPWPLGPLMSVEERLDRPEVLVSFILVILAVFIGGKSPPCSSILPAGDMPGQCKDAQHPEKEHAVQDCDQKGSADVQHLEKEHTVQDHGQESASAPSDEKLLQES